MSLMNLFSFRNVFLQQFIANIPVFGMQKYKDLYGSIYIIRRSRKYVSVNSIREILLCFKEYENQRYLNPEKDYYQCDVDGPFEVNRVLKKRTVEIARRKK